MAFRDGKKACVLCDQGTSPSPTPGTESWDADCLATDEVGHFVYITGPSVAGVRQVTKVDITNPATMPAIGMIVSKATPTRCTVQVLGEVATAGLSPGTTSRYWVGADSKLSNIPPAKISGKIVVQVAGAALDNSVFMLRPDLNPVKLRG